MSPDHHPPCPLCLACARALLDELDSLEASSPSDARAVVLQIAEELVRTAQALRAWAEGMDSGEGLFPESAGYAVQEGSR